MAGPQFHSAEQNLERDALRELVATICVGNYRDRNGVGLLNNLAFLKAKALLELSDAVGTRRADDH
ncbi:hypothetical protein [Phenylobacterium sp.]|uniref:hypothetical protein n=1 Tax=Phenylobacterium sp. TaxID=1871053 RepID=UPI0025E4FE14|nr:hypothetical protein [Phenylobacterium sp.]